MGRVSNKFQVVSIATTELGSQRITFNAVYSGDPELVTGTALYNNSERNLELLVPKTSSMFDTFVVGAKYYMDLTLIS